MDPQKQLQALSDEFQAFQTGTRVYIYATSLFATDFFLAQSSRVWWTPARSWNRSSKRTKVCKPSSPVWMRNPTSISLSARCC